MAKNSLNTRRQITFSEFGINDIFLLGSYNNNASNQLLPTHIHENIMEICFLKKGNQIYQVQDDYYFLRGGDIFLTFPEEAHGTGIYPQDKGVLYWLQINLTKELDSFCNFIGEDSNSFRQKLLTIKNRHFKSQFNFSNEFEKIFKLFQPDFSLYDKIQFYSTITNILIQVINNSNDPKDQKFSIDIQNTIKYIEENAQEQLSIESLANLVNLSPSRFKAKFKSELGMPPGEFITRKKIDYAKELLSKGSLTITDISYKLNFSNSQYFSSVFKKYTQQTPTEFQKQFNY
ncbi:MAG: hypothetical protein COA79_17745 [Planctomycetota bacterium]|nr:MAG: hypothetical protein COA79_17745 [Planctomycetota bacterium]